MNQVVRTDPVRYLIFAFSVIGTIVCGGVGSEPLSTGFTYQGELKQGGVPANGVFDFQFELYDVNSGGAIITSAVLVENVTVNDGVFSVELDFTSQPYAGDQLWLEVGVRDGASTGGYTGLLPRQKLTAAPYALHAEMVALNAISSAEIAPNSVGSSEVIGSQVQLRVDDVCPAGTYLSGINQNGSVTCEQVTEVVYATNASFDNTLSFVSELSSSAADALTHTVTTTRSGHLQISLLANVGIGCSPSASTSRYYYIVLNGSAVASSVVTQFEGIRMSERLAGVTENVIPAGTHTISVGAECNGSNTPNVTSWQFASNVSVTVLPSE